MGADYIPEDSILARRSKARTVKLIQSCTKAHFNMLRVWGGGYYRMISFTTCATKTDFLSGRI
jgi:beta-mannosidase